MQKRAGLKHALQGIQLDRLFLSEISGGASKAGFLSPTIRAAFLFRIAAAGGTLGKLARSLLMLFHGSDCTPGAVFHGPVYFPHPVGIVIGSGVRVGGETWIYQHVTLGADAKGSYPTIGERVRIYPGAVVAGGLSVGQSSIIGAGVHLNFDIPAETVIPAAWVRFRDHTDKVNRAQ